MVIGTYGLAGFSQAALYSGAREEVICRSISGYSLNYSLDLASKDLLRRKRNVRLPSYNYIIFIVF